MTGTRRMSLAKSHIISQVCSQFSQSQMHNEVNRLPRISSMQYNMSFSLRKTPDRKLTLPNIEHVVQIQDSLDGSLDLDSLLDCPNDSVVLIDKLKKSIRHMSFSKHLPLLLNRQHDYGQLQPQDKSPFTKKVKTKETSVIVSPRDTQRDIQFEQQTATNLEQQGQSLTELTKNDSEISDFELKVEASRVFIQKGFNKKRVGASANRGSKQFGKMPITRVKYEKEPREYNDLSVNRYLSKKKRGINLAEPKAKIGQGQKSRKVQGFGRVYPHEPRRKSLLINLIPKKGLKGSPTKPQDINRQQTLLKQQALKRVRTSAGRGDDIFGRIDSILENKHKQKYRSQLASNVQKSSLSLPMTNKTVLKQLQRDFRILQQKESRLIGSKVQPEDLGKMVDRSLLEPQGLLEWHRIAVCFEGRKLNPVDSDFATELGRINDLQSMNQQTLGMYVFNRKVLIDLDFQKKLRNWQPRKLAVDNLRSQKKSLGNFR